MLRARARPVRAEPGVPSHAWQRERPVNRRRDGVSEVRSQSESCVCVKVVIIYCANRRCYGVREVRRVSQYRVCVCVKVVIIYCVNRTRYGVSEE